MDGRPAAISASVGGRPSFASSRTHSAASRACASSAALGGLPPLLSRLANSCSRAKYSCVVSSSFRAASAACSAAWCSCRSLLIACAYSATEMSPASLAALSAAIFSFSSCARAAIAASRAARAAAASLVRSEAVDEGLVLPMNALLYSSLALRPRWKINSCHDCVGFISKAPEEDTTGAELGLELGRPDPRW